MELYFTVNNRTIVIGQDEPSYEVTDPPEHEHIYTVYDILIY